MLSVLVNTFVVMMIVAHIYMLLNGQTVIVEQGVVVVKMPILKAFPIVFRTVSKKKGMWSIELASEAEVQQKPARYFELKIKNAMIQEKKLKDKAKVEETLVGGYCKGYNGRNLTQKTQCYLQ
jgi:hypothetical protein